MAEREAWENAPWSKIAWTLGVVTFLALSGGAMWAVLEAVSP